VKTNIMRGNISLFIIIVIIIGLSSLGVAALCAQAETTQNVKSIALSLNELSRLVLMNSLDIQTARYDALIKRTSLKNAESVFDTVLNAQINHIDDQQKTNSTFSGTHSTINEYSAGLSKKLPTGTTLRLEAGDTRVFSNSTFSSLSPAHEAQAKFSINQPLGNNFFGLIDRGRVKITKLDVKNSDFQALGRIEQYLADAQVAYWRLVLAYRQLNIARKMLDKAETLYELFQKQNKLGLIEDAELYAAQANVMQRQNNVSELEHQLLLAKNNLLLYIHEEDLNLHIIPQDAFIIKEGTANLRKSIKTAIANNRDYQRAKNDLEMRGIKLAMKQNSIWPEIDLELSYAQNGLEPGRDRAWSNLTQEDNPELVVGLSLSVPLENSAAKGSREKARLEKKNALLALKKTEHQILVDVANSVDALNNKTETIKINRNIVELQEKKLDFEEKRFSAGRSNTDTLIRYQEDLLNSQLLLAQSLFDYEQATINLKLSEDTLLNEFWQGAL